jgi:DNA-binding CsgD family transcriptional regulator
VEGVYEELTPRDVQVAKWVARGLDRRDVALALSTSKSSVDRHMRKVVRLTRSRNGIEAVAVLMALGLLSAKDATSMGPEACDTLAGRIAPGVPRTAPGGSASVDVSAWVLSQKVPAPEGEAEEHVNQVLDSMAAEWASGNARLPIPGPRRDPDAPRPPQQPKRDT